MPNSSRARSNGPEADRPRRIDLGIALGRDAIGVAGRCAEEVERLVLPARLAIEGDELALVWAEADGPSFGLDDARRLLREPVALATFLEGLLVRILLERADRGHRTGRPGGLGIALETNVPADWPAALIEIGRRLGFEPVQVVFGHEALAVARLLSEEDEASARILVGPGRTAVVVERRPEGGRPAFLVRPDEGPAATGDEIAADVSADRVAVAAAGLVAAGAPPIVRRWVYGVSFDGRVVHFPDLLPVGAGHRRVAWLAARADRPAFDPSLFLHAGLARGRPAEELSVCGRQSVNKWVLEDNGGRFLVFLEVDDDGSVRWGHAFARTGERHAATVAPEVLVS